MVSLELYRDALRLYPKSYRQQFGEEMLVVFRDLRAEAATQGTFARSNFCLREVAGLVAGAFREHGRVLGSGHFGLVFSNRRFTMRNEFRFPKATAVLMTINL